MQEGNNNNDDDEEKGNEEEDDERRMEKLGKLHHSLCVDILSCNVVSQRRILHNFRSKIEKWESYAEIKDVCLGGIFG